MIADCKEAGIAVRMVTGDDMITAAAIAVKCGIINDVKTEGAIWDGKDFRERVKARPGTTEELNQDEFDKFWVKLRVTGRSTVQCVCVCVYARECFCACVCVCVCVCAYMCIHIS